MLGNCGNLGKSIHFLWFRMRGPAAPGQHTPSLYPSLSSPHAATWLPRLDLVLGLEVDARRGCARLVRGCDSGDGVARETPFSQTPGQQTGSPGGEPGCIERRLFQKGRERPCSAGAGCSGWSKRRSTLLDSVGRHRQRREQERRHETWWW